MGKNRKKVTRKMKENTSEMGDTPASFDSPESSSITHAFYDPLQLKLTIYFKRGKSPDAHDPKPFVYIGVPVSTWIEFEQAASKGKFFSSAIRPMYKGSVTA